MDLPVRVEPTFNFEPLLQDAVAQETASEYNDKDRNEPVNTTRS